MTTPHDENVRWVALDSGVLLPMRVGDGSAKAKQAVKDAAVRPAGTAILQPWYATGGPANPYAAYELTRRQLNGLTKAVDSLMFGAHAKSWGGNLAMLNTTRARSVLGQKLTDPDDTKAIPAALWLLQEVESVNQSVALNRPGFVVERVLRGDVSSARALIELRERLADGATSTGPWIQAQTGVFQISKNGAFYTEGGLFLFGSTAHAILRGGSIFVEGGGNLVLMGTGVTSDDPTGFAAAFAATTGGEVFFGDLYSANDLTFRVFGDIVTSRPIDGGTAKVTTGALVLRELSGAQITALGTPASGLAYVYVKDSDELPYIKDDDGTETALGGGGGVSDHGALTGLSDDDHTQYLLADGSRESNSNPQVFAKNSLVNDVTTVVKIRRTNSGTPDVGLGVALDAQLSNDAAAVTTVGRVGFLWTDLTNGAEFADHTIELVRNGALVQAGQLTSGGVLTLLNPDDFSASLDPVDLTANRDFTYPDASGVIALESYVDSEIASAVSGISASPTTTLGDMIYNDGGGAGSDVRLPIGPENNFMYVNGDGEPDWTSPETILDLGFGVSAPAGSIPVNEITDSTWGYLGPGSDGDVLQIVSGFPEWVAPTSAGAYSAVYYDATPGSSGSVTVDADAFEDGDVMTVVCTGAAGSNLATFSLNGVDLLGSGTAAIAANWRLDAEIVRLSSSTALVAWNWQDAGGGSGNQGTTVVVSSGLNWGADQTLEVTMPGAPAGEVAFVGAKLDFTPLIGGAGGGESVLLPPASLVLSVRAAASLVLGSGNAVDSWTDMAGLAQVFAQTSTSRPTYTTDIGDGNIGVDFDGSNDHLVCSTARLRGALGEIWLVVRVDSVASNCYLVTSSDEGTNTSIFRFFATTSQKLAILTQNAGGSTYGAVGDNTFSLSTTHIVRLISDGAAWSMEVDGADHPVTAAGAGNSGDWFGDVTLRDNVCIGALKTSDGPEGFLNGQICEVKIFDGCALSDAQAAALLAEWAEAYGVTV